MTEEEIDLNISLHALKVESYFNEYDLTMESTTNALNEGDIDKYRYMALMGHAVMTHKGQKGD